MEMVDQVREQQLIAQVPVGALFEHYKGKRYRVLGIARHSETLQMHVIYETLYEPSQLGRVWVRPLEMFLETIVIEGKEQPRFRFISEE